MSHVARRHKNTHIEVFVVLSSCKNFTQLHMSVLKTLPFRVHEQLKSVNLVGVWDGFKFWPFVTSFAHHVQGCTVALFLVHMNQCRAYISEAVKLAVAHHSAHSTPLRHKLHHTKDKDEVRQESVLTRVDQ